MDIQDKMVLCEMDVGKIYECETLRAELAARTADLQRAGLNGLALLTDYDAVKEQLAECQAAYWNKTAQLEDQLAAAEALLAAYREALEKIVLIECVDDLHHAEDALCNLPTTPTTALNNAIADELEKMADFTCTEHDCGWQLRERAKELRENK